ncbi:hypothetical protein ILYODFUR_026385 [Ilyodon furcidens]|uniref:Uncharacterized protein n=1 Tax=Ilyodon furcidens TaxID=33524 RepID=A0ABV0T0D7_9TELE
MVKSGMILMLVIISGQGNKSNRMSNKQIRAVTCCVGTFFSPKKNRFAVIVAFFSPFISKMSRCAFFFLFTAHDFIWIKGEFSISSRRNAFIRKHIFSIVHSFFVNIKYEKINLSKFDGI